MRRFVVLAASCAVVAGCGGSSGGMSHADALAQAQKAADALAAHGYSAGVCAYMTDGHPLMGDPAWEIGCDGGNDGGAGNGPRYQWTPRRLVTLAL
jgi:hypothetical protein